MALVWLVFLQAGEASEVEFDGFLTTGYAHSSSGVNSFDDINHDHNFLGLTKFGLNVSTQLQPTLDFRAQITAAINTVVGTRFALELAKLSWRPCDEFALQVGIHKVPIWLISDYQNVGVLYPWVRLPNEVYGIVPLTSFAGVEAEYDYPLRGDWLIKSTFFAGGFVLSTNVSTSSFDTSKDAKLIGIVESLSNHALTLRASYTKAILLGKTHIDVDLPTTVGSQTVTARNTIVSDFDLGKTHFLSASAKVDWRDLFALSEFALLSSDSSVFKYTSAFYGSAGYYFWNRRILPLFTVGRVFETNSTLFPGSQTSYTATLNYWPTSSVVLKGEYQFVSIPAGDFGRFMGPMNEDVHFVASSMSLVF